MSEYTENPEGTLCVASDAFDKGKRVCDRSFCERLNK